MWLGHAIAAPTWRSVKTDESPLPLDYYMYSAFTENPGNQCYVHSGDSCKRCVSACGTPPDSALWLPGFAYTGAPDDAGWGPPPSGAKACVTDSYSCGKLGLQDVVSVYATKTAEQLWADVEAALRGDAAAVNLNVFDVLLTGQKTTEVSAK